MYRLTKELFDFLFENGKDGQIGLISPFGAVGTENEYTLEEDVSVAIPCKDDDGNYYMNGHESEVEGYWLWRNCDLTFSGLSMVVDRGVEIKEEIIKDVLVKSPSVADKRYEATPVGSISELLKLEPGLKKYIN